MSYYSKIEKILLKQGKFYISLELDRIKKILSLFDNPQNKVKIIHVAGANGKGSTCAMINQILIKQGFKTGLYTSPHLVKYNERIKINNECISDENFYKLLVKIDEKAQENAIVLTEFELLTAVMYIYFYEQKVDYAVVEVGLGGRFDATNCIENSVISVITSISKDHTEKLGESIEKIAYEKSGIIKHNGCVIFNKNNFGRKILTKTAQKLNCKIFYPKKSEIIFNDKNILKYGLDKYELSLLGKYQAENASLALCAIDVLNNKGEKISDRVKKEALKDVSWSGRFQYIKEKNLIIDGSHNPDGARVLKESLDLYFPNLKRVFIYTSLKNKDYKKYQKILFENNDLIYHYKMDKDNFIHLKDVKNAYKSIDILGVKELIKNKKRKELLIICGSLYALGDILGKINLCS